MFPIFEKLGGQEKALSVLEKRRGRAITPSGVRFWILTKRIPAINAMHLMAECQERGIACDFADFELQAHKEGAQ